MKIIKMSVVIDVIVIAVMVVMLLVIRVILVIMLSFDRIENGNDRKVIWC